MQYKFPSFYYARKLSPLISHLADVSICRLLFFPPVRQICLPHLDGLIIAHSNELLPIWVECYSSHIAIMCPKVSYALLLW